MYIIKIIRHLTKADTSETTCIVFEKSLKIVYYFYRQHSSEIESLLDTVKDSHSSCPHHVLPGCQENFLLLFLSGPCSITLSVLSQSHLKSHKVLYQIILTHTQKNNNNAQHTQKSKSQDTHLLTSGAVVVMV